MADSEIIIPKGYCQCGCGQTTTIAKVNDKSKGWIKGKPIKFLNGHNKRIYDRPAGTSMSSHGYMIVRCPAHPKARDEYCYIYEHILKAEKALGKPLPPGAQVHHFTKSQLVICQDASYHKLLHKRQRAYEACGNPNWGKCWICQKWDTPKNLVQYGRRSPYHPLCYKMRYKK